MAKEKGSNREALIQKIGEELLREARNAEKSVESSHRWEIKLLEWCMSNDELKTQIFRFIDVFPSLKSDREVVQHIKEYFPSDGMRLPKEIRIGLALTRTALLTAPILSKSSEFLYKRMAKFFIGAGSIEEAIQKTEELENRGVMTSIDLLGELTTSDAEAGAYEAEYRKLFKALGARKKGPLYQNVSLKLSALDPNFDPIDPNGTQSRVFKRLIPLIEAAALEQIFVYIDMEHFAFRDLTLRLIRNLFEARPDFISSMGIVLQAYLADARQTADSVLNWAGHLSHPLTIRLVRGAYWDTEIMKAEELGWPIPVFLNKAETDQAYEELAELFLAAFPKIRLAVGTHNIRSVAHAMAYIETEGRDKNTVEFQLLYGLGAPLEAAIRARGYSLRLYTPVGDPLPGMAYLVRRLLENVSQQSFLRQSFWESASAEQLLKAPSKTNTVKSLQTPSDEVKFKNEPALDFSREDVRLSFEHALKKMRAEFGQKIPLFINGKEKNTAGYGLSLNPAHASQVVAEFACADKVDAEAAVRAADEAFPEWSHTDAKERAGLLRKAADILRHRRFELAALEVFEVGKPWREADGDVCEAIDYLEYYAAEAVKFFEKHPTEKLIHESNFTRPESRGVSAVIAPWNFPLAIITGMSAAALASGNTVILKPAEQSILMGWQLLRTYREAGFPQGTVNFLSGSGAELGPVLVEHPRVALIAFTGSREVGLEIIKRAASAVERSGCVKKVISEMGGKNAIVIDASADFDQSIPAVLESAFGYSGQKCSAASRLILLESIARPFLKRLCEAAASFIVGDPTHPGSHMGPLIDSDATKRLRLAYEEAKKTGTVFYRGDVHTLEEQGYFVPPTIAGNLPLHSPLLSKELFGPFLTVSIVRSFDEALKMANQSEYALTGGVFSRTPSHIDKAAKHFAVGNLYINRKITGAIVRRQPFGGYKLSGGGSKAGGEDYLREFVFMRTITENRMRHGFSPLQT